VLGQRRAPDQWNAPDHWPTMPHDVKEPPAARGFQFIAPISIGATLRRIARAKFVAVARAF